MIAGIMTVSDRNFARFISDHPVAVIYVRRACFKPCRLLLSILNEFVEELHENPAFGQCVAEDSPELVESHGLYFFPTALTYIEGCEYDRHTMHTRNLCSYHF